MEKIKKKKRKSAADKNAIHFIYGRKYFHLYSKGNMGSINFLCCYFFVCPEGVCAKRIIFILRSEQDRFV